MARRPLELEEGWSTFQKGFDKLTRLLEGVEGETQFNAEQYMHMYTTTYNMCTQKPPYDFSSQLYQRYQGCILQYNNDKVLPRLQGLSGEALLRGLTKSWANHQESVKWWSRFFNFLDRVYVPKNKLMPVRDVGLQCFQVQIYDEMKAQARDALIQLVQDEREGQTIDTALVKDTVSMFVKVDKEAYVTDLEAPLLAETAAHYQRKTAELDPNSTDYRAKVTELLQQEQDRMDNYLPPFTNAKLLKEVESISLTKHESVPLPEEVAAGEGD